MITLYGRRNSGNVQKVLWTLDEIGIGYQRRNAGGSFGGTQVADYLALNPNGKVPTLVDGDLALFESNTILRYLAARYGNDSLWPADPAQRAAREKWMDWELSTLAPVVGPAFLATIRTAPAERDHKLIAARAAALADTFGLLDRELARTPYLSGAEFGLADIPAGTLTARYRALPLDRPTLVHVDAWFERLSARPAFRRHVLIEIGSTPDEWTRLERAEAGQTGKQ